MRAITIAAGAWGLLRNVFQEFAAFGWSGLDIDAAAWRLPRGVPHLADAFGSAFRAGLFATPRMLPHQHLGGLAAPRMDTGVLGPRTGAWVITGGLGGLGLLSAQWAALQLAGSIRLLDTAVRALPALLCQQTRSLVRVVRADCSSLAEGNVHGGGNGRGPVEGVMHAAGVLQDALLLKQTAASFRAVLSGKVGSFKICQLCLAARHLVPCPFLNQRALFAKNPWRI